MDVTYNIIEHVLLFNFQKLIRIKIDKTEINWTRILWPCRKINDTNNNLSGSVQFSYLNTIYILMINTSTNLLAPGNCTMSYYS